MKKENPGQRKKLPLWGKILLILLAVVLALLLAAGIGVNALLDKIGTNLGGQETIPPDMQQMETDPDAGDATSPSVNREDISWEDVEQLESKDIINILLIGQDARPGEERARSDSMILVSINKQRGTIHLTSFMRDLYVQIPGYMDDRINVAYRYGGTELLNQTIQANFGVSIDGNVAVNFVKVQTIIDGVGGVVVGMDTE